MNLGCSDYDAVTDLFRERDLGKMQLASVEGLAGRGARCRRTRDCGWGGQRRATWRARCGRWGGLLGKGDCGHLRKARSDRGRPAGSVSRDPPERLDCEHMAC